jgi:hypothetical protein
MSESSENAQSQQVTTGFLDQTEGIKIEYDPVEDPNMLADYQPEAHLAHFLSRPQLVKTIVWSETDVAGTNWTLNPWYAFFNSGTTRKKLDNFAFINCNLVVKFVVNASPFYFGSQLVAYQPMAGYYTPSATTSASTNAWFIPFSQMPHIWMYPQTCQGGEMKLPFFYHKNWLPLTATDTTNMGLITGAVVNQLASANGVTGAGVTIQVWAWAEDVKLLGPTINLSIQAKERRSLRDEYPDGTGIISKPASSVARVARELKNLPVIGGMARATEAAAGIIGPIASLFGFSNPPVIQDVQPFQQKPFGHFASPTISMPIEKLTLDPKQELTIDPRIAGLPGDDELLLQNLVTRESYLTTASITTSDAVDTVKFNSLVNPNLIDFYYDSTTFKFYPTPIDHFSRLFQYWRGDIIFRFRFICTQYHKGRVRITYDPVGDIVGTVPDYTSVFNEVVDIGVSSDVEVRVPYMQAYGWLRTRTSTLSAPTVIWHNNATPSTYDNTYDNGTITVRVVTPITAPVASSNVYMQVFVRAAENFDLAAPQSLPPMTFNTLQCEEVTKWEVQSADEIKYDNVEQIITGGQPGSDEDTKFLVNMGERIVSLRTLLRRTVFSYSTQVPADTTSFASLIRMYQTNYPPWYGYDSNGRNSAKGTYVPGSNFNFNYVTTTPFQWIGRAFVGMRGAMMWSYNVDTVGTDSVLSSVRMYRNMNTINTGNYLNVDTVATGSTSSALSRFYLVDSGTGGSTLTNQVTNTSLQACLPDYNYARFHWLDPASGSLGFTADGSAYQNAALELKLKPTGATKPVGNIRVDKYFSIGPDFTFFFYLCAPPWTWLPLPTAN